jgi:hypothetical protein
MDEKMNLRIKKPNFFIIGAAKAGTTSLFDILGQHPHVYFPFDKEPAYFNDDDYYSRGDEWYLRTFFKQAKTQPLRGEATPHYLFYGTKVAPRIYNFSQPDTPKFIAIFRDPAKLVNSFYWNSVREGKEVLPLKDALHNEQDRMNELRGELERRGRMLYAYSQIGAYAQQVLRYLAVFPRERFMYLLTDDLADFPALVTRLQMFLELEDHSANMKPAKSNVSALPKSRKLHQWLRNRSLMKELFKPFFPISIRYKLKMSTLEKNLRNFTPPEMDAETANSIREHYKEDTKQLQDIIQRDLSKWLPA